LGPDEPSSVLFCAAALIFRNRRSEVQRDGRKHGPSFRRSKRKKSFQKPMGQKIIAREFQMAHIAKREKEEFGKEVKKAIIEAKLGDLQESH
jgi:hypothetical protein